MPRRGKGFKTLVPKHYSKRKFAARNKVGNFTLAVSRPKGKVRRSK